MEGSSLVGIISFIASVASLILAGIAIWLSIVFYKMSDEASKSTREAAKDIGASVQRLEKLFDKLYSDTFSIMRDTVTDMRKHIWHAPEKNSTPGLDQDVKDEINSQISSILESDGNAKKTPEITERLEKAVQEIISKSSLHRLSVDLDEVVQLVETIKKPNPQRIANLLDVEEEEVGRALFHLRQMDRVSWDGEANVLSSDTVILPKSEEEAN